MPITKTYPTTHFIRAYKSLPEKIKILAKERESIFLVNPFDNRLKTHKLKGKLSNYWAYSVDYQHRIIFRFIDQETVLYFDIGTHDIYNR